MKIQIQLLKQRYIYEKLINNFFKFLFQFKIIINAVDKLLNKNQNWQELSTKNEKSKSITKLFDTIDTFVFEKKLALDSSKSSNLEKNFLINTENIVAEVSSNHELKKEISFPSLDNNVNLDENAFLTLKEPSLFYFNLQLIEIKFIYMKNKNRKVTNFYVYGLQEFK